MFTPGVVARFMASLFSDPGREFCFVDAGAGIGVLSAAICERIARRTIPCSVHAILYENDPLAIPSLARTLEDCRIALCAGGHELRTTVREEDFILARPARSLYSPSPARSYADAVVMNPPYQKLPASGEHARVFAEVVHGQPNSYALFMACGVELLREGGRLVAVTPRSFCSGPYFREFRRWFLDRMSLHRLHVFDSRRETFADSDVLQECMISAADLDSRQAPRVLVSTSRSGVDQSSPPESVSARTVIGDEHSDRVIRLPTDKTVRAIIRFVESWSATFADRGLQISTGPVVAFRAREHLLGSADTEHGVALITLRNVRPYATVWPIVRRTGAVAMRVCDDSAALLLPSRNYALLRRFSAKEERQRLTASPFVPGMHARRYPIAIENHVNYVTHADRELEADEVHGLVALFNSPMLDAYFRAISGSTQVNATEIRAMPFPDLSIIARIGREAGVLCEERRDEINEAVARSVGCSVSMSFFATRGRKADTR